MVVEGIKRVVVIKKTIAAKVGRKVAGGEALMHLFYGGAIFTELKEGITLYSVAAVGLGVFAILGWFFGGESEG